MAASGLVYFQTKKLGGGASSGCGFKTSSLFIYKPYNEYPEYEENKNCEKSDVRKLE